MTTIILLDTDVVSFILKGDTRAALYQKHLQHCTPALSFMTVAELYQWAFTRRWGSGRIAWLEAQLQSYLIFPYDAELCKVWAQVCVSRQRAGRPFLYKMLGLQPRRCVMAVP